VWCKVNHPSRLRIKEAVHSEAGAVRVGRADDLSIVIDGPPIAVTASAECAKISDNAVGPEHGVAEVDPAGVRRAYHVTKIVDVPRYGPWTIRQPGQLNDAVGIGVDERRGPVRTHGPADDVSLLVNAEGDARRVAGQDPQILHDIRRWVSRCGPRCQAEHKRDKRGSPRRETHSASRESLTESNREILQRRRKPNGNLGTHRRSPSKKSES